MKVQSVNYNVASNKPVASKAPEAPKAEPTVSKEPMDVGTIAEKKDWTVLVYLNGNNATASQAVTTMRQLEFVGSNDKMHMAAQLARPRRCWTSGRTTGTVCAAMK